MTAAQFPQNWARALALSVSAAVLLYAAAVWWAGAQDTVDALAELGISLVALGTTVATVNLFLRFWRWHWLLGLLGSARGLTLGRSALIYLGGLALTATPGKVGETLRSLFLSRYGVPISSSLGLFLTDRAMDVLGVAALGLLAAVIGGAKPWGLMAIWGLGLGVSLALACAIRAWNRNSASDTTELPPRWKAVAAAARRLASPLRAWADLWRGGRLLAGVLVAVVAYGVQALVLAAYVEALNPGISRASVTVVFVQAVLLGAASMLPGGLGATEAALVAQLMDLGMPAPQALAAALALRLSTLWTAMLIGVMSLMWIGQSTDRLPSQYVP
jgi:uncharacterized protein (TIRG00374 family)